MTETVTILKDPHSAGTEGDIRAQVAFSLAIREELNEIVDMINRIEWMRKRLGDLRIVLEDHSSAKDLLEAVGELEDSAIGVEGRLFDVHLTGAREDAFRGPMKLYGRLSALASDIGGWGADFPPTEQQIEVHEVLEQRLNEAREAFKVLVESQVPALNEMMRSANLGGIIVH